MSGYYNRTSGDYDGDGRDDILWTYSGGMNIWWGNSNRTFTGQNFVAAPSDAVPFSGDFNGDGYSDVFFRSNKDLPDYSGTPDFADTVWLGEATRGAFSKHVPVPVYKAGKAIPGDYDGDGRTDILWHREL